MMAVGTRSSGEGAQALFERVRREIRADRRKAIALAILLPALAIAWLPLVMGRSRPAAPPAPTPPADSPFDVNPDEPGGNPPIEVLAHRMAELRTSWVPRWSPGKDDVPFVALQPPPTGPASQVGSEEKVPAKVAGQPIDPKVKAEHEDLAALRLSGTYLSKVHGNLARIGEKLLRVGDRIGSFQVKRIAEREVVLAGLYGEYALHLEEGGRR